MKHILIPTNFSTNSWNALEYAVHIFTNERCIFYMLHIDELSNSNIHTNSLMVVTKPRRISSKEKLQLLFKKISNLCTNPLHQFIALEEYGNFIDIVKKTVEAKKIDIIVMGTKGAIGLKASVIGTNTGNVITKVACNVLVIPENTIIKVPSKIAFPTDFNLFYTYPILNSITEILEISNAKLDVIYVTQFKPNFSNLSAKYSAFLLCCCILICSVLRFFNTDDARKLSIVAPKSIEAPLFTFLKSLINSCVPQTTPPTVSLDPLINLVKLCITI